MALTTAAEVPTMPISPIPRDPMGVACSSTSSSHSTCRSPMSACAATW
ncbi:hypothetical protein ACFFX0_24680 [Citricoccus parietis]|uniref:Uncharacterized protein n=1 Tax=Citricoccus parietis TaxID=592307 RepID=A0ABV5G5J8_9MICC